MSRCTVVVSVAAILIGMGGVAHALPITFFDEDLNSTGQRPTDLPKSNAARDAFMVKLRTAFLEDFESFSDGTIPTHLPFGGLNASITGGAKILSVPTGTYSGVYPISGSRFLFDWQSTGTLEITFPTPYTAFGLYATDVGDWQTDQQFDVVLSYVGGETAVLPVPHTKQSPSGSALYFGVISADRPFESVTLKNRYVMDDGIGFDDMTVGQVVPLPGAIALGTIGAGLVGWLRRRRTL